MKKILVTLIVCFVLASCGGSDAVDGGSVNDGLADIHVFRSNAPHANVLKTCALVDEPDKSCALNTLPLIGMAGEDIDKDAILDRLLVSHDWMGERFAEVLARMPADLLTLFRSATMVIIDADVRPSYYWAMNGAIYLDPAFLWLSDAERKTVNADSDYRAGFGTEIPYLFAQRYVYDERALFIGYTLNENAAPRALNTILLPVARLLYHELAHANDFFPVSQMPRFVGSTKSIVTVIQEIQPYWLSNLMGGLNDRELYSLARVFFRGEAASEAQKTADPAGVGTLFHNDGASQFYSYHTRFEDFANLFEATMMNYHGDFELEVGVLQRPEADDAVCDDYLVRWGTRNRVAEPLVNARAAQVARLVFPESGIPEHLGGLVAGGGMRVDEGWCSNVAGAAGRAARLEGGLGAGYPHFEDDFLPVGHQR